MRRRRSGRRDQGASGVETAPADPASRWTSAHRGPAFYAYSTNYLIDLDHAVRQALDTIPVIADEFAAAFGREAGGRIAREFRSAR